MTLSLRHVRVLMILSRGQAHGWKTAGNSVRCTFTRAPDSWSRAREESAMLRARTCATTATAATVKDATNVPTTKLAAAFLGRFDVRLETDDLNMRLRLALQGHGLAAGFSADLARMHSQIVQLLETTDTAYDGLTLDMALRLAKRIPHSLLSPHKRMAYAVRILQRARHHQVAPSWYAMLHFLALVEPCRKAHVNLVLALYRIVEQQQQQQQQQHASSNDFDESSQDSTSTMRQIHDDKTSVAATALSELLRFLLHRKKTMVAAALWKSTRAQSLEASRDWSINAKLLRQGAWICALTKDIAEANWITEKYNEFRLSPDSRALELLTSAYIHAGHLDKALEMMQWSCRVGFVLHERQLHYFMGECMEANSQCSRPPAVLEALLFSLGDVILSAERLCSDEMNQIRFLRSYFDALCTCVRNSRLGEHAWHHAFTLAHRVFEHYQVQDSILSSYVVFLAACGGQLDMALQIAFASHNSGPRSDNVTRKAHGTLHAFAYEALVEQGIKENRLETTLKLVDQEEDGKRRNMKVTVAVAASFIRTLGKLDRVDVCSEFYRSFSSKHGCCVVVSTAYMAVLDAAARPHDALLVFRQLSHAPPKRISAPTAVTYAVLASVVLKGARHCSSGDSIGQGEPLSILTVSEMADCIEGYLRRAGEFSNKLTRSDGESTDSSYIRQSQIRKASDRRKREHIIDQIKTRVARIRRWLATAGHTDIREANS